MLPVVAATLAISVSLASCSISGNNSAEHPEKTEQHPSTQPSVQTSSDSSEKETMNSAESNSKTPISQELIKVAQLSQEQVGQLAKLDGQEARSEFGKGIYKVILPGYLPSEFKLNNFTIENNRRAKYDLGYRNSDGKCFSVGLYTPGAGTDIHQYETIVVKSHALGHVPIEYTNFGKLSNQPLISLREDPFEPLTKIKGFFYSFYSPSNQNCNPISLEEARKIVESLEYLFPDKTTEKFIEELPKSDENGDYYSSFQGAEYHQAWVVTDKDSQGLNCRSPNYFSGVSFPLEKYWNDLSRSNQDVTQWNIVAKFSYNQRLRAAGRNQKSLYLLRETQGTLWIGIEARITGNLTHCFVRANQRYIAPL